MNRSLRSIVFFILLFNIFFLCACSGAPAASPPEKPVIAVTILPVKAFVEAVAGDSVDVISMIPPGGNPENFEPTPLQIQQFSDAALYFTVGLPLEEAKILPQTAIKSCSLDQEVSSFYPDRFFADGERDPHIWLSPKRAEIMVSAICRELSLLYPKNKADFEKNAASYIEQLQELDQRLLSVLSEVKHKSFVTYHPAFGYLAEDYDMEMFSLEEDGKEATPKHLAEMIDLAKQQQIKVIFYQEEIDSKQAEAYAEEIGGKTQVLSPLSENYIENLEAMAETIAEAME